MKVSLVVASLALLPDCVFPAGVADPFAMGGGGAAAQAPSSPAAPAAAQSGAQPVRPVGDINEWFRKLCQNPSGVLYEDQYLQVDSS